MKLQKFKENKKKEKSIIVFTIACVLLITGVFLYKTFASFQVVENEDLINGNISDPGDIYFVFYKDGTISKTMPLKNEGYAYDYEKSHCEVPGKEETLNKAIPYFDSIDWSVTVKGMSERPTKCTLYFYKGYQDENLHGADPVLERPLIPVHIDETGKVTKADPSQKWYDYEKKEWANAVILVDETKQYEVDQEIEEKDIESYFVWIPRYRYKLKADEATYNLYTSVTNIGDIGSVDEFYNNSQVNGNKGASTAFEIEFENITETPSEGTKINEWLTHPAFTSFNCNGFWVGKFETGYKDAQSRSEAEKSENTDREDPSKVIIKPNAYSWRSINVSNAFYTSYNYIRELDSHLMKNSEWGAVAYLTQSKYGRCASDKGPCEEVRMNNNQNYITGYSAKNTPTCGLTGTNEECNKYERAELGQDGNDTYNYFNFSSVISSTTGNYTGIYDLSGGAWEIVMAVMKDSNGNPASGQSSTNNSGFNGMFTGTGGGALINGKPFPGTKYYDLYDYNETSEKYQRGHIGDATKEMGPFYSVQYEKVTTSPGNFSSMRKITSFFANRSVFVSSNNSWFIRGGCIDNGSEAGIFAFDGNGGQRVNPFGFRVILTP